MIRGRSASDVREGGKGSYCEMGKGGASINTMYGRSGPDLARCPKKSWPPKKGKRWEIKKGI